MARVKDLWFSEVPVKDAEGKTVRDPQGRPVTEKKKTKKHPDNGGSKDAKRWLACWDGTDGKEKTRTFEKKAAAEKYATSMEADALRGIRYADPKLGAITVREYGETKFMPAMLHLRPNSADTYASHEEPRLPGAWCPPHGDHHQDRRAVVRHCCLREARAVHHGDRVRGAAGHDAGCRR